MEDDEVIRIKRQVCCRLCLAPDFECVSVFTTAAADKEPLPQKIQSCVNIKIHELDRLSSRICHACISYLNSWQSFKTRCYAAQRKQKSWLAAQLHRQLGLEEENGGKKEGGNAAAKVGESGNANNATRSPSVLSNGSSAGGLDAYNYYPQYHRKGRNNNLKIKEEPKEEDDGPVTVNMELDPSQFLAGNDDDEDEDDDEMEEGEVIQTNGPGRKGDDPLILTSLGLTNVSHVNPFNYLATDLDDDNADDGLNGSKSSLSGGVNAATQCRICQMRFSNRANARRHERNIHGIQIIAESNNNNSSNNSNTSNAVLNNGQSEKAIPSNRPQLKPVTGAGGGGGGSSGGGSRRKKMSLLPEVFDYTKPEKYRHLLTESRMAFIKRNARFLHQYQDMTCKCCDKKYFTYKTFMSHMRKKYTTLPRNVCFKCLRKFETKGQFIAHLKKKNCPNLFTLYMADPAIPSDAKTLSTFSNNTGSDRFGPKEILANKVYGCRICSEQFRLKNDFRTHVINVHPDMQNQRDPVTGNCGNCNAQFADSLERKRHFSNMECLVVIICGTCENQYDSHAKFIQHVYATHMKQLKTAAPDEVAEDGGIRNQKTCPVCAKDYNNYYNLLRHIESKHPDQMPKTYKCEICQEGFARQNELKDHVKIIHSDLSLATVSSSNLFTCKECKESFEKMEGLIDHQEDSHDKFSCYQCDKKMDQKNEFRGHLGTHLKLKVFSCNSCKQSYVTEEALKYHTMTSHMEMDSDEAVFKKITKLGLFKSQNKAKSTLKPEPVEDLNDDGDDSMNDSKIDDSLLRDSQSFLDSSIYKAEELQRVRECPICIEKYPILTDFIQHMRIHVKNDQVLNIDLEPGVKAGAYHSRMRCRVCQKRISSKIGYKKHLLEEHQIEDCEFVRCDLCPGEFSNEKGLKVHMYRTHNICIKEDGEVSIAEAAKAAGTENLIRQQANVQTHHFECDICHTVYRNQEQLKSHVKTVHAISYADYVKDYGSKKDDSLGEDLMNGDLENNADGLQAADYTPLEVWFQCRYCDENFNSRQKLTVHMNTHVEHDPTDYTCKDCGNVYQSRKSLWVHRHKKHPRPQTPSPCEICKKVFFDKTELVFHLKTHVAQKMDFMNELMDGETNGLDGEPDDGEGQYVCHVCDRKFTDQERLSKHIRIHEMQNNMFTLGAFTEAGMDDSTEAINLGGGGSGGIDYQGDESEFACDICPKKFTMLTALKVHRGWHFRSPDGRQITDPQKTWQPGSLPPSRLNRNRPQRTFHSKPPRCPHCNSTFASSNNLRRHIVEVHKRNDWKQAQNAQTDGTLSLNIEREGECQSCGKQFNTRADWVDHKISHARTMRPSTTFEWGCEICGKVFTRKERLLQHMATHLTGNGDGNTNSSQEDSQMDGDDDEVDDEDDDDGAVVINPDDEEMIDDEDDENANHGFAYSKKRSRDVEEPEVEKKRVPPSLSCELCQISFKDANELRRHVTSHFINGVGKIGDEQIKGKTEKSDPKATQVVKSKKETEKAEIPPVKKPKLDVEVHEEEEDDEEEGEYVEQTVVEEDETENDDDVESVIEDDDVIEDNFEVEECEDDAEVDEEEEEGEYLEEYIDEDKIGGKVEVVSPPAQSSSSKCRICDTRYDSNFKSIKCMESHRRTTQHPCEECDLYFLNPKQLSGHLQVIHGIRN